MENKLIQKIIKEKIHCYFVSPHFDDAALSASDLMAYLSTKTDVSVINVFTKAGNHNTLSARKFVKDSGFDNARLLFKARDDEDRNALSNLQVDRTNLGFTDALWRTQKATQLRRFLSAFIPELNAVYPTYRFNIQKGKIANADIKTIKTVATKLAKTIKGKKAVVFSPAGIGNHVDHLITKEACKLLGYPIVLWTDFPYIQRNKNIVMPPSAEYFTVKRNVTKKTRIINTYKTQIKGLFPKAKFKTISEKYYILNDSDQTEPGYQKGHLPETRRVKFSPFYISYFLIYKLFNILKSATINGFGNVTGHLQK